MQKTYSPEFKVKFVIEVFWGERLANDIASENNVHPNMLTRWKAEACCLRLAYTVTVIHLRLTSNAMASSLIHRNSTCRIIYP